MRKEYDESDDGRVVADMTGIERRSVIIPKMPSGKRAELNEPAPEKKRNESLYQDEITPEQTRWYIFGALKAAFMIGAVYAVAFGLVILLLILIWNH